MLHNPSLTQTHRHHVITEILAHSEPILDWLERSGRFTDDHPEDGKSADDEDVVLDQLITEYVIDGLDDLILDTDDL